MHYILSDDIDTGKSAFVLELTRRLVEAGRSVSGWITPAHMDGELKIGHDLVIIEDGRIAEPVPFTRRTPFEGSFQWRRYHFNRLAFEKVTELADRLFRVTDHESRVTDLFIMDEVGPLELEEGEGFMEAVRRGIEGATDTVSVIRTGLAARFTEFLDAEFAVFSLDEGGELATALNLTD